MKPGAARFAVAVLLAGATADVELGWTRVGGSEACGGPGTASPVRLVF